MSAEVKKARKGKKNRKLDRNRKWCEAYRNRGQREKNKAVKLKKHLSRHPNDKTAVQALCHCD